MQNPVPSASPAMDRGRGWGDKGRAGTPHSHHVVFSLENLMPGTRPMRLTIMCRRLLPVSTFTALPMVVLSRLSPFTSVILSPTHRPARSARGGGGAGMGPVGQGEAKPFPPHRLPWGNPHETGDPQLRSGYSLLD